MKTLILIVVTLHLVIGGPKTKQLPYKYGDIIAFPRAFVFGKPLFKHYGIYVDKKRFPEQKEDENLFHLTGPVPEWMLSGCIFSKINPNEKQELDNYLDKFKYFKKGLSEKAITKRIKEKYKSCKKTEEKWNPRSNNCEHLATYVRYGAKISLQCGKIGSCWVKNTDVSEDLLNDIKQDLEETQNCVFKEFC